jgi:hypothetical protein
LKPPEVQKHTRIQSYNTLALPTLLYGTENSRIKPKSKNQNPKSKITATEMIFMRIITKYTFIDSKEKEGILK